MHVFIHWLEFSHNLQAGIDQAKQIIKQELCPLLGINHDALSYYQTKKKTWVVSLNLHGKEVFAMSLPKDSYGTMTIKGSFFDAVALIDVPEVWKWIQRYSGNCKRQDISFLDLDSILAFRTYDRMSRHKVCHDFISGSCMVSRKKPPKDPNALPDPNNRQGLPDSLKDSKLIHYGDANTDYAKFYERPDGKCKFEITIVNKDHNKALLSLYDPISVEYWEETAKAVLVSMLNFSDPVTGKQIASYTKFLATSVKPIIWSRLPDSPTIEPKPFVEQLSWHIGRLSNLLYRNGLDAMQDDVCQLAQTIQAAHDALSLTF
jgi:hypothetical protein